MPTPLGGFSIGSYQSSYYTLFLAGMAVVMMAVVYVVMSYTRFGLIARATMQNPAMAATLGVNPARVYMSTFAVGAAITGLAGGLLAPVSGITPGMGGAYVAKAFMTVVGEAPPFCRGRCRRRACSVLSIRSAPSSPRRSMARSWCSRRRSC